VSIWSLNVTCLLAVLALNEGVADVVSFFQDGIGPTSGDGIIRLFAALLWTLAVAVMTLHVSGLLQVMHVPGWRTYESVANSITEPLLQHASSSMPWTLGHRCKPQGTIFESIDRVTAADAAVENMCCSHSCQEAAHGYRSLEGFSQPALLYSANL
jgi:hypothetical protein